MATRGWSSRRFDLMEVFLFAAFVGLIVFVAMPKLPPPLDEETALAQAYGPNHYSENEEEWIIRDFYKDRRGGFFLDVGAFHYSGHNNTYYLESVLGWSGIAIEPLREYEAGYLEHRPRTRFFPLFVSDTSDKQLTMYTLDDNFLGSSSDRTFVERFGDEVKEVATQTIRLDDLLTREKVTAVDFMSMDIELSEPKALAGFDIERYRPSLVCIEAHAEVRQQILDYFTRHGYVVIGKYLRVDEKNLYFTPLEPASPLRSPD